MLSIFRHLDWEELLALRGVSKQWSTLVLTPVLYTHLTLLSIPSPLPSIMKDQIMQSVRYLDLNLFPYLTTRSGHSPSALISLLEAIPPSRLKSLSVPFSAAHLPGADLGGVLRRIGTELEYLDVKGSGLVGSRWISWLADIGKEGDGLQHLDVGFTAISSLPTGPIDEVHPLRNLRTLKMASCTHLSPTVLSDFLEDLPPTIETLDLSRLDHVSFEALWHLKVVHEGKPTRMKEIKVVGIDHLTRRDVRRLKAHWEEKRRNCFDQPLSSPIMLPSTKWGFSTPPTMYAPLSPPTTPDEHPGAIPILSPSPTTLSGLFGSKVHFPTPPQSVSPPSGAMHLHEEDDEISINIVHSAILESEDEDGYRRFIGEVANGVMGPTIGLGMDVPLVEGRSTRSAWVEVDGGGPM